MASYIGDKFKEEDVDKLVRLRLKRAVPARWRRAARRRAHPARPAPNAEGV
jgi:hypothetical protein